MRPLKEYSASRIGERWTEEDHAFLLHILSEIDRTVQEVYDLMLYQSSGGSEILNQLEPSRKPIVGVESERDKRRRA